MARSDFSGSLSIIISTNAPRYGLRWQIVSQAFIDMLRDEDTEKAKRGMEAMLQMVKRNVAKLQAAFDGEA